MLTDRRGRLAKWDWRFLAAGGFVLACLVLGGGAAVGFLSDVLIQLVAIPILLVSLWRYLDLPAGERPRWVLILAGLVVAVPALQLVPLPPELWTLLPGRAALVDSFMLLNSDLPWAPLSVAPTATWLSLVSLLPPLAVFFATLLMDFRQRRLLTAWLLAFGAVSVFLGLSQVAQGQTSPLRFFANTNPTEAVGFFANRNHLAALLYTMILLAAAWASGSATQFLTASAERRFEAALILPIIASFMLLVIFVAGEILSRSRAGLGLTIVALLGACVLAYSDRRRRSGMTMARLLLGLVVLTTLLVVQFGLYRVIERFADDPLADGRVPFARNTIEAALAFLPFGSGLGTFTMVYPTFEKTNDLMPNTFANHAHNDILELWLETGVPGAVIAMLCAAWILYRMLRVWRAGSWGTCAVDLLLARAASVAIGLVVAHSLFDYPLRTGAMMTLVAFCCALLTPSAGHTHLGADAIESDASRREPGLRPTPVMVEPGPVRSPALGGERWGKGIEWPDAWRRPGNAPLASPRGRGSDNENKDQ